MGVPHDGARHDLEIKRFAGLAVDREAAAADREDKMLNQHSSIVEREARRPLQRDGVGAAPR